MEAGDALEAIDWVCEGWFGRLGRCTCASLRLEVVVVVRQRGGKWDEQVTW